MEEVNTNTFAINTDRQGGYSGDIVLRISEGGRVITCVLTMEVVDNRHTINVCVVDNMY